MFPVVPTVESCGVAVLYVIAPASVCEVKYTRMLQIFVIYHFQTLEPFVAVMPFIVNTVQSAVWCFKHFADKPQNYTKHWVIDQIKVSVNFCLSHGREEDSAGLPM